MSENAKDYALVQDCLQDLGLTEAMAALDRIKQNRQWEVTRARNNARSAALEEAAKLCDAIDVRVHGEFPKSACCNCYMAAEEAALKIREAARRPS